MKTKLCTIIVAAVMIVATLFVSCAPASNSVADDTVSVFFGELQAKDTGIDDNVYTTTPSGEITSNKVDPKTVETLYWSYKAEKADENFKSGETRDANGNLVFKPVIEGENGTGLKQTIEGFSKGKWNFTLQAFTSDAERTAGTPVIYEGSVTKKELLEKTNAVDIAAEYAYSDGSGTVNFDIDVNIVQTLPTDEDTEITYYEVTKVIAYAGDLNVELSGVKTSAAAAAYEGTWTGSIENVPFGMAATKYEIYVGDESTPRATVTGSSVVMTNLETTVEGTATITLTEGTMNVSFANSTLPTNQPTITIKSKYVNNLVTIKYYSTISDTIDRVKEWKVTTEKTDGTGLNSGETGAGEENAVTFTQLTQMSFSYGEWLWTFYGYDVSGTLLCSGEEETVLRSSSFSTMYPFITAV